MALGVFASFRGYVLASILLTTAVFSHAIYMKRLFYRSVVFLAKSKFAILAAGNMALVSVLLLWRLVQFIFLGPLRFREIERLHIRARDAIIECCFALTIFREEFNSKFVALVTTLLLLKSLHWLTKDRIEYLEEQPLSPLRAHLRLVGLIVFLFLLDTLLLVECVGTTIRTSGPTMFVLFAFEFAVLVIELSSDFVRYLFHVVDLYMEGRWEGKGLYSFYNELLSDMCQLTVYILFFMYVQIYYTFPIHIIRELYMTFHKFQRRCSDFIRYRRVMATMNDLFADATEEELAEGDRTCIICREEMMTAKKLSCGHMFHARCLQSWLKRQLSCPTCRAAVDVSGSENQAAAAGAQNEQQNRGRNAENNDANAANNPDVADNPAPAPDRANAMPGVAGNEIPNMADGGARLINFANRWWDQVMVVAGAGPNNAARDAQGNPRPAQGIEDANRRMQFHGPNAVAHMQLRARRRGAWQQPYQPYQIPQQPNHQQYAAQQQQQQHGFIHPYHQDLQALRQDAVAAAQNGAQAAQPSDQDNRRPQMAPNPVPGRAAQAGSSNAPNVRNDISQTEQMERATASAIHQWEQLQRTALAHAGAAASPRDAPGLRTVHPANVPSGGDRNDSQSEGGVPTQVNDSLSAHYQEDSNGSSDPCDSNQRLSLPLERLLAIQEQIEVLRGEVQELVLLATSSPQETAAFAEEESNLDNLQSGVQSSRASDETPGESNSLICNDDAEIGKSDEEDKHQDKEAVEENVGNPEDDETANLRRRRIEFLERRERRNES